MLQSMTFVGRGVVYQDEQKLHEKIKSLGCEGMEGS